MSTNYPLFMDFRLPVPCKGFWVGITMRGRLLLEEDGDEFWVYGVNPGGISAFGPNKDAALNAFTVRLREVVSDAAEAADKFPTFKMEIEESFATNDEYAALWEEARKQIREGTRDLPGMKRDESEYEASILIEEIEKPNPTMSTSERVTLAQPKAA